MRITVTHEFESWSEAVEFFKVQQDAASAREDDEARHELQAQRDAATDTEAEAQVEEAIEMTDEVIKSTVGAYVEKFGTPKLREKFKQAGIARVTELEPDQLVLFITKLMDEIGRAA
jgi:hypothetical protein